MEKINIAELLKDCPKGTKLYSPLCGECEFDHIEYMGKIVCQTKKDTTIWFLPTGVYFEGYSGAECVLFPSKENRDWSKFQKPFKDGDILSYQYKGFKNRTIYIYMQHSRMNTTYYVALSGDSDLEFMVNDKEGHALNSYNDSVRLATKEEKEKLFQAIKDNGYKWNEETKTLEKLLEPKFKVGDKITDKNKFIYRITEVTDKGYKLHDLKTTFITFEEADSYFVKVVDVFDITTLKPFAEVLVRQDEDGKWGINFFGVYNYDEGYYYTTGNWIYRQCIPYKGNEYLLDTTNDCDEFYKTWEL